MSEAEKPQLSRRDFTRQTALAASAACLPALLPGAALEAQEQVLSAANQAEVDTTVAAVVHKYGNRMTDAQKLDVRRIVTENQKSLEAMRSFALENADQPGNVMKIYPEATPSTSTATRHDAPQNKR
jgi:hypothetical protein